MFRSPAVAGEEEDASRVDIPPGLAGAEHRVGALLSLLAQLDQRDQETLITECFTHAEKAQQLAELRQAVDELTARAPPAKRA